MSTAPENQNWEPCHTPDIGDILKWNEPLWAKPNKPRGKRDKIGEQQIIGEVLTKGDLLELKVIAVTKLSAGDAPLSVNPDDQIMRRSASITKGLPHKRVG